MPRRSDRGPAPGGPAFAKPGSDGAPAGGRIEARARQPWPSEGGGPGEDGRDGAMAHGSGSVIDGLEIDGLEDESMRRGPAMSELDWLDPSARQAAQLAPPGVGSNGVHAASGASDEPVRARSLEELLPVLVRRIAWAGDRQRGTVRLELGAGAYAGATIVVHADGGRVRVEIGGSEGPDLDRLRARLDARLRGHGLDVESVT